jgi:anaerobic ribonucleoside-triphosphate reductase
MGLLQLFKDALKGKGSVTKGEVQKCPNCGETILIGMERCPKCGTHIKSMFRRKCPKCGTLNELDSKACSKCKFNFEEELKRAEKTVYVCPICGYRMDALMTSCPACGTRFM